MEHTKTQACKWQCKDCNINVCSHCTASSQHSGHKFLNLEELFTTSKKCIQNDREELNNKIIPTYEEIVNELEIEIASLDGEYKKLTTEMSKQRAEIHLSLIHI